MAITQSVPHDDIRHNDAFSQIPETPTDPMYILKAAYAEDDHPLKVNLGPGTYRDENGAPYVLPSIREATTRFFTNPKHNHEYLTLQGHSAFLSGARKLVFGADSPIEVDRIASYQSIGGTGACHLGAGFLKDWWHASSNVYISDPTWENHHAIFRRVGFTTQKYPYWNASKRTIDIDRLFSSVASAPNGSIFVLHACGHNPTGCDLVLEQWKGLADIFIEKGHFAFFDSAYLGFASGDIDRDAQAIRLFAASGVPLLVAQSFSKNAGMYGERLGALHILGDCSATAKRIIDQLKVVNRSEVSTSVRFPAEIVSIVLQDGELFARWKMDLKTLTDRIRQMRELLVEKLTAAAVPGNWTHLSTQSGMFGYTSLSASQCKVLVDRFHIYIAPTGRANISGLNLHNIHYVADSIGWVVKNV